MNNKEAAEYIKAHCNPDMTQKTQWEIAMVMAVKALAETADAVKVVRCKDCEYWKEGSGIFDFSPYCELTATKCDGEHFCSWGEKSVLRNQN